MSAVTERSLSAQKRQVVEGEVTPYWTNDFDQRRAGPTEPQALGGGGDRQNRALR